MLGFSERCECALSGKLKCHHKKAEEIQVHSGNRLSDQGCILAENTYKKFREEENYAPDKKGIEYADRSGEPDSFFTAG